MVGFECQGLYDGDMTTKRGPYAKGRARREEILAIALEVIARDGYRRTSFREIADAAGLSKTGLLHYFSTKEELFREIVRVRDEGNFDAYTTDAPDIVEGFAAMVRHNSEVPGLAQLYAAVVGEVAAEADHPSRPFLIDRYSAFRALLVQTIHSEQAKGRVPAEVDAERAAVALLAAADGLQTQWLLDPSIDMALHLRYVWNVLMSGS